MRQLVCSPKKELLLFGFKLLFFFRIRGAIDGSFVVAFAKWRSSKFPLDNFSYEVVKTSSVSVLAFRVGCRPIPRTTFPVLFVLQLFLLAAPRPSEFLENLLHFTHAPKISYSNPFSSPEPPFLLVTWSAKRRVLVAAITGCQ